MIIESNSPYKFTEKLSDMEAGDTFRHPEFNCVFLKTDRVDERTLVVNLLTGHVCYFINTSYVCPVRAKVVTE